jgi:ribonuclease P protein component
MLASQHRMRSTRDFQSVRRNGKKVLIPGLVIHIYLGMYGATPSRVGLTVGKDCGNAVQRHRVSRRVRATMGRVLGFLPAGTGLVVKALPQVHTLALDPEVITEALLLKVNR